METVDAATGQLAPRKVGRRKRKRAEVDEDISKEDCEQGVVQKSPKRKVCD